MDNRIRSRIEPAIQRVLVVDPNMASSRLIADIMKSIGAREAVIAHNRKQALLAASELNPGVIFTESAGVDLNGVALAREIRRSTLECRRAPIIMVTSDATARTIIDARDAGVHEFLRKPFTSGDLFRRVENVTLRPRDWIEGMGYIGPDRRRFNSGEYDGPRKRGSDRPRTAAEADRATRDQAMKILASAFKQFDSDPVQAQRSAREQAGVLKGLALRVNDANLAVAAASLERALNDGVATRTALAVPIEALLSLADAQPEMRKAG